MLTASYNWKRPKDTKFQKFSSGIVDPWIIILQITVIQSPKKEFDLRSSHLSLES